MRQMFDSITPSAIPTNAALVAGYVDGAYAWSAANWARFPNSVKVRIAVFPRTNDGHVLDVEQGDATPAQAPGWVTMRRAAGVDPSIYCDVATWPDVVSAFASAGVAPPHYWVASYPGAGASVPAGAIAHQYADHGPNGENYDISVVADYWPGVDQGGPVSEINVSDLTPDGLMMLGRIMALHQNAASIKATGWGPVQQIAAAVEQNGLKSALDGIQAGVTQLLAAVGAVDADVKTSTSSVLAAIAAGATVNLTSEQVAEIEATLVKSLPGYTVNIVPAPAG